MKLFDYCANETLSMQIPSEVGYRDSLNTNISDRVSRLHSEERRCIRRMTGIESCCASFVGAC